MFHNILIHYVWLGIIMAIVAFIVSYAMYPTVLRAARVWRIYDNPDARKLQRYPIPVLGGVTVYFGIVISLSILLSIWFEMKIVMLMLAATCLLLVGVWDDIKKLSVAFRFLVEIGVVLVLVFGNGSMIDSFHGLWGVEMLPLWLAYLLSIITGVGIINSINLIDGVDGYSSGYSIISCLMFALLFYVARIPGMAIICLVCTGGLLPFFLHNVFGKKTKMFIGDGGTLMIGTLMTSFVFSILKSSSACMHLYEHRVNLIALTLAILCLPVFDTLRVMSIRMIRGNSPFKPDKTHLHHLFIDYGFSHVGTTIHILCLNILVVLIWLVSWVAGANIELQLYIVILMGVLITFVLYSVGRYLERKQSDVYRHICSYGAKSHIENGRFGIWMQKLVDDELFSDGKNE